MKRADFIKQTSVLIGTTFVGSSVQPIPSHPLPEGKPFNLDYAPHEGMFATDSGGDFLKEIARMNELGFRSIEDNGMAQRSLAEQKKIGTLLESLGMRMGVFVVPKGGNAANTLAAGKQDYVDIFLKGCQQSLEVAKRVNAHWVTVVPGDYERHLPIGIQTANVIEALKRGASIFENHGIQMVLEPLSDTPDLFLRYTDQAYQICQAVDSPSCKILYDVYHQQKNEGNLITFLDRCWNQIAYIQVGDNPGRNEPTTGEINYKNIFKWLYNRGYKGIVGMEHGLSASGKVGEESLLKAYREVDDFIF